MKIKVIDPKQIADFPSFLLNSQAAMIRKTAAFSLTAQFEAPTRIGSWTYTDVPCVAFCMLYQNWEAKTKPQWVFASVSGILVNAKTSKFEMMDLPSEVSASLLKSLNKFLKKKMLTVKSDDFLEKVSYEKQQVLRQLQTILGSLQEQGGQMTEAAHQSFVELETTQAEAQRKIAEAEAMMSEAQLERAEAQREREEAQREIEAAQREADEMLFRAREQTAELMTLAQMHSQGQTPSYEEIASLVSASPEVSDVLEQSQLGHETTTMPVGRSQSYISAAASQEPAAEPVNKNGSPMTTNSKSKLPLIVGVVVVLLVAGASAFFLTKKKKVVSPKVAGNKVRKAPAEPVKEPRREVPVRDRAVVRKAAPAKPKDPVLAALQESGATLSNVVLRLSFGKDSKTLPAKLALKKSRVRSAEGVRGEAAKFTGRSYVFAKTNASLPTQTYELWFKTTQKGKAGLFSLQTGTSRKAPWRSRLFLNDGGICFDHFDGKTKTFCSKGAYKAGKWNHVAVTIDAKAQKLALYVNGEKQNEGVVSQNGSNGELYLGIAAGRKGFRGQIDEFVIHSKALTAAQVKIQGSLKTSLLLKNAYSQKYSELQNSLFAKKMKSQFEGLVLNKQLMTLHFDKDFADPVVKRVRTRNAKGISKQGLRFDGRRSYVQLKLPKVPAQQTMELWFNPAKKLNSGGLVAFQSKPSGVSWQLQLNYNGSTVCLNYYDTKSRYVCGKTTLKQGAWHHVAVTMDSSSNKATLYLDGKAEGSFSFGKYGLYDEVYLGVSKYGKYFKGEIDEFAIHSAVLSPAQLKIHATKDSPILREGGYSRYINTENRGLWKVLSKDVLVKLHGDKDLSKTSALTSAFKNSRVKRAAGIHKEGLRFARRSQLAFKGDYDQPALTLEAWVKLPKSRKGGGLLALETRKTKKSSASKVMLNYNGSDVCFTIYSRKGHEVCSKSKLKAGQWIHVAAVVNKKKGRTVELFLNGKKEGSTTFAKTMLWGELYVGSSLSSGVFQGTLDEIVVYKRALTPAQLARHATLLSPVFRP